MRLQNPPGGVSPKCSVLGMVENDPSEAEKRVSRGCI
eukprot:CAMPEP_0183762570 /NCGR_PEP_ID=MMETSP0739-20130205/9158_1 /TAXON_ID=385413 /ORGANISM="Thalassiosira miniscula, Strain CCMP1093" /LENGTH=36 /DNA_ID= /DNA_START= /DNA_END= /DNA_ORIENTATION=